MAKRRVARGAYKMTARRRVALKKAQAASARKRRKRNTKRVIGGVAAVAGIGAAAYAGHKYGGSAKTVAGSIRNRFKTGGISVGGITVSRTAVAAVQPGAKEATRVAGAVSPAAAPRHNAPKVKKPNPTMGAATATFTRTQVPTLSKTEQSELMKEATAPRGPSWLDESSFNEDGTVTKNALAGISKELVAGKQITAQQAHHALSKKAKASGISISKQQRQSIVNAMIAEGTVSTSTQGKKARKGSQTKVAPRTEAEWQAALGFD